jgi:hypothetical protein
VWPPSSRLNQEVDALGGFSIDEGGIFLIFLIHSAALLLGLEQLLHGHGLVDMVLGLGDSFSGDQEPHPKGCLGPRF